MGFLLAEPNCCALYVDQIRPTRHLEQILGTVIGLKKFCHQL